MNKLSEIKTMIKGKGLYGSWLNNADIEWLIKRTEKAERCEELALEHHYQTILDEMD